MFLDDVQVLACGSHSPPPGPVTVLPPLTIGTPEVLPEIADAASAGARTAGINPEPVMTRVALDVAAPASPTPRASATATPLPTPTPTPKPPLLRQFWDDFRAQVSPLACLIGLGIFALIVLLFVYWIRSSSPST
jgi:hypothetical protein